MKEVLKSNTEWKQWGKYDPLWGVASWPGKQVGGKSPWVEEDFYALGRADWHDFLKQWRSYGVTTQSCLEIGCGTGRLTRHIAETFDRVYALDVSEDMITRARKAVGTNVEFSLVDGRHLPQCAHSVTAVFSTHVLQHLDAVEDGFSYLQESFRVLKPGGTIMIHVPLYQFPLDNGRSGVAWKLAYSWCRILDNLRSEIKRRLGMRLVRMTPYPIRSVHSSLSDSGYRNIQIRLFETTSNADLHPFIFATK